MRSNEASAHCQRLYSYFGEMGILHDGTQRGPAARGRPPRGSRPPPLEADHRRWTLSVSLACSLRIRVAGIDNNVSVRIQDLEPTRFLFTQEVLVRVKLTLD